MPIKVDPSPIGALQSRPPNPFAPKLRNSQFGPNGLIWKFLAHTLTYNRLTISKLCVFTLSSTPD